VEAEELKRHQRDFKSNFSLQVNNYFKYVHIPRGTNLFHLYRVDEDHKNLRNHITSSAGTEGRRASTAVITPATKCAVKNSKKPQQKCDFLCSKDKIESSSKMSLYKKNGSSQEILGGV
jgi:hypothetical protein